MDDSKLLYENVKGLCKEHAITITQLESQSGLTRGSVNKWLSTYPSWDKLLKVAIYFDVSLDYLVGRTNDRESHKSIDPCMLRLFTQIKLLKINNLVIDLLLDVAEKVQPLL